MSEKRCYYEVLGIQRQASEDEIRKNYRQCALKFHPDRNPNDPSAANKFKEATEAFSVLSDSQKRARYDQFGHAGLEAGGFDFSGAGIGDIFSQFQDLFSEFFVGGAPRGRRQGPRRGGDLRIQERLTLKDAVLGCKKEVVVRAPTTCESCGGSGAAPGSQRHTCGTCRGAGQVSSSRGFVMFTSTCPTCQGEGSVLRDPCTKCSGAGQVEKMRKVLVTFPAGIDTNQRLRVPGQGLPGPPGGEGGDLYVDVELEPDDKFERDGVDLITRVNVSFSDAALGTNIALRWIDDSELELEIPAGTQPGDVITMKGKGAPRVDGRGRGALHVQVQVDVPRHVSPRAKALLAELEEELKPKSKRASTA
ncbi:MAG TPA: molecular chaperone DnaJ [Polyangiaceae bacterium]|jgi:molecular chaperone DnaJ|nr:molecular chaperone DnaJ [Polyangiaceae bacterium]